MTDQKKAPESSEETDETAAGDGASETDAGTETHEGPTASDAAATAGSGRGLSWLALVMALGGLGGVGWLAWQQFQQASDSSGERIEQLAEELRSQASGLQSQSGRSEEQGERIDGLMSELATLQSRLEELSSRDRDPGAEIDPLRESVESQARATEALSSDLDALGGRLDSAIGRLEERIDTLQSRRDNEVDQSLSRAERRLALIEISGLLRLAQAGTRLSDDPAEAIRAYEQAIARVEALDDPRAQRVREALAGELEALKGVEQTDWAALVGRLAALEGQSASWPMAGEQTAPAASAEPDAEAGDDAGNAGWWSGIRRSLGGLVRVTPRASAPLGPAAAESVRERVRLHLAGAQVAATRRQPDALEPHLSAVSSLLDEHFDSGARSVRQARTVIEEVADARTADWPELGAALAEVQRQLSDS